MIAALITAIVLCAVSLAAAQVVDPAEGISAGATIIDKPDAKVPLDLRFVDEAGQSVRLGDYFRPGRPVLLVMVYFQCPQLCNLTLNGLTEALRQVELRAGEQFEVVIVSFKPEEDAAMAAAKKANYIRSLGKPEAAAGWHFLTSKDPVPARELGNALGFGYRKVEETGQYMHEACIYICASDGRVSRVDRGVAVDPGVVRDSLINASQGKISSGLFGVALACGIVHFDAQTGKYTWVAMAIMRVTGIATLIVLGAGIGWMVYRERRQKLNPEGQS